MPDVTSWTEVERLLKFLGARIGGGTPDQDGNTFYGPGGFDFNSIGIYNQFDYWVRSGVVIAIRARSEGYYDPLAFQEIWDFYSPDRVVRSHGPPSRVWVETVSQFSEAPGGDTIGYFLWLYYDQEGFVIRYAAATRYEAIYRLCPALADKDLGIRAIDLYIQSSTSPAQLEEASGLLGPEEMDYILPLDQAAGISVDEFYALFVQSGKAACFETPRGVWP